MCNTLAHESGKVTYDHCVNISNSRIAPYLPCRLTAVTQLQTQWTPLGLNPSPHSPSPRRLPFCASE